MDVRCIRCGDIGGDPDLNGVCLECDYDTSGEYTAPTDHAGTVITAGARVEHTDGANGCRHPGTVLHTGNVTDDGTVRVMRDDGQGTYDAAPEKLNVIDPHDAAPGEISRTWIYPEHMEGSTAPGEWLRIDVEGRVLLVQIPREGILTDDDADTAQDTDTAPHTAGRATPAHGALETVASRIGARLERSDIGRA